MPDMMQRLGIEHRNMTRLLNVLEQQLAVFERGDRPDYDVLTAVADYFRGFPDRCHHPKEDRILARMRLRDPARAAEVGDLEGEHRALAALAQRFRRTVESVANDAELPRSTLSDNLRGFVEAQREHMDKERRGFFLLAEAVLTPEDWLALEAEIAEEEDPAFGSRVGAEYEALQEQILAWQEEDEAIGAA